MALRWSVLPAPAPIGALTVGVTGIGLALVSFGDDPGAAERAALRLGEPLEAGGGSAAEQQLREYLAGERRVFDVPLDWRLTAGSQRRVLEALFDTVVYGATVTYGELAARSAVGARVDTARSAVGARVDTARSGPGHAHTAARGVGAIMGSNPIPVVVPCHRVLAADGLGGFGGGRATKEWLLALEGVLTPALDFGPE
jgi:methylated-DNA-[protein]-cysteine S-methyltransferase